MNVSRLDKAVTSVPAGPSPADDHDSDVDLEQNLDADDPTLQGDDSDSGDQSEDKKSKRGVENVRGELLRKMQKQHQQLQEEITALRGALQSKHEEYGTPAPARTAPQTLDDMSIAELETMAHNIPEEHKANFLTYLQERKVDAKVESRLREYDQTTQFKTAEQRFNAAAVERWPALRDRQSEFYRTADRILSEMGPGAASNPRAVLDSANEAGIELGLSPATGVSATTRSTTRRTGNVASTRNSRSAPNSDDAAVDDRMRGIANRLSDAMPGKKFTEEQLKRIAERSKQYRETISTRVRG